VRPIKPNSKSTSTARKLIPSSIRPSKPKFSKGKSRFRDWQIKNSTIPMMYCSWRAPLLKKKLKNSIKPLQWFCIQINAKIREPKKPGILFSRHKKLFVIHRKKRFTSESWEKQGNVLNLKETGKIKSELKVVNFPFPIALFRSNINKLAKKYLKICRIRRIT